MDGFEPLGVTPVDPADLDHTRDPGADFEAGPNARRPVGVVEDFLVP